MREAGFMCRKSGADEWMVEVIEFIKDRKPYLLLQLEENSGESAGGERKKIWNGE